MNTTGVVFVVHQRLHETADESSCRRTRVPHVISRSTLIKAVSDEEALVLKGLFLLHRHQKWRCSRHQGHQRWKESPLCERWLLFTPHVAVIRSAYSSSSSKQINIWLQSLKCWAQGPGVIRIKGPCEMFYSERPLSPQLCLGEAEEKNPWWQCSPCLADLWAALWPRLRRVRSSICCSWVNMHRICFPKKKEEKVKDAFQPAQCNVWNVLIHSNSSYNEHAWTEEWEMTGLFVTQIAEQTDLQLHTNPPQELQKTSPRKEFYLNSQMSSWLRHFSLHSSPIKLVYISVIYSINSLPVYSCSHWMGTWRLSLRAPTGRNTVLCCFRNSSLVKPK